MDVCWCVHMRACACRGQMCRLCGVGVTGYSELPDAGNGTQFPSLQEQYVFLTNLTDPPSILRVNSWITLEYKKDLGKPVPALHTHTHLVVTVGSSVNIFLWVKMPEELLLDKNPFWEPTGDFHCFWFWMFWILAYLHTFLSLKHL